MRMDEFIRLMCFHRSLCFMFMFLEFMRILPVSIQSFLCAFLEFVRILPVSIQSFYARF